MSASVCELTRGMKLKEWLMKHLLEEYFHGLTWLDEEARLFKLSWTEQDKPSWEDTLAICQAWTIHKDGSINGQSFSTLKGRFRDALRNSNNIKEMKNLSQLNRQTGNYKVFKFLSAEEIKENKKLRKESNASTLTTSPESSQDTSNDALSVGLSNSDLDSLISSLDIQFSPTTFLNPAPHFDAEEEQVMDDANPLPSTITDISTSHNNVEHFDNPPHEISATIPVPEYSNGLQLLQGLGFNENQMNLFDISIVYESTVVFSAQGVDFINGCHAIYGPWSATNSGSLMYPEFPVLPFPPVDNSMPFEKLQKIVKVLNNLEQGAILQTDSNTFDLYGKRLCLMKVFSVNSKCEGKSIKMEQDKPVMLFSYMQYIQNMMEYRSKKRDEKPKCEVMLSFGTSPSSLDSRTCVSLVIQPRIATDLENMVDPNGSSSILFSNEKSWNASLEMITGFQNDSRPPAALG